MGVLLVGFAPITPLLISIYGVSPFATTFLVTIFSIMQMVFNFPSNYIMDNYGIAIPTYIASFCHAAGAWIWIGMWGAEESGFAWLLFGQTVAACGCAFIISGPSKVSTIWFGDNERAIATTIGALSVPIGSILGFVLPMFFIWEFEDNEWTDPATKVEAIR
mgnify:CR=1 FL=1